MRLCTSFYIDEFSNLKDRVKIIEAQEKWAGKDIYHCRSCGQLSYSSADKAVLMPRIILPEQELASINLVNRENIIPADLNELLKFEPGYTGVTDVIENIGRPFAQHTLETGVLLCYHSNDRQNPHSILIDPLYKIVKLVAIHNDYGAFDLNNLGKAYGTQELVTRMEGFEFWMYEAFGVAKVTEGFSDDAILYVQFFEKRLDMDRYMEMNCFLEETFFCDGSGLPHAHDYR